MFMILDPAATMTTVTCMFLVFHVYDYRSSYNDYSDPYMFLVVPVYDFRSSYNDYSDSYVSSGLCLLF